MKLNSRMFVITDKRWYNNYNRISMSGSRTTSRL